MGNKQTTEMNTPTPLLSVNMILDKLTQLQANSIFTGAGEKSPSVLEYEKNLDLLITLLRFMKDEQKNTLNPIIVEEDLRESIDQSFKNSAVMNQILDSVLLTQTPSPERNPQNRNVQPNPSILYVETTQQPQVCGSTMKKLKILEQEVSTAVPRKRLEDVEKKYQMLKQEKATEDEEIKENLRNMLQLDKLVILKDSNHEENNFKKNFSISRRTGYLSLDKKILLVFQANGNFVSYDVSKPLKNNNDGTFDGVVLWQSNTANRGIEKVEFKDKKIKMQGTYTIGRINPTTNQILKIWDYKIKTLNVNSRKIFTLEIQNTNGPVTWTRIL